jgi:ABC-type transporter Mla subunit MlaD
MQMDMNHYRRILFIVASTGVVCCGTKNDNTTLHIRFDSVTNLDEHSEVYYKNTVVGEVTNISIINFDQVLVTIDLNKSVNPTQRDTIALVNRDLFGNHALTILPGKTDGKMYNTGDTVPGIVITRTQVSLIDSATLKMARDSLITPHIKP